MSVVYIGRITRKRWYARESVTVHYGRSASQIINQIIRTNRNGKIGHSRTEGTEEATTPEQ